MDLPEPDSSKEFAAYPRPHLQPKPWPWWVRITMIGLKSRAAVLSFGWLCIVLAAVSFVAGFFFLPAFGGVLWIVAAWPYFESVKWLDRHDAWRT